MKKAFVIATIVFLLFCGIYISLFSFVGLDLNSIAVVEDRANGKILEVYHNKNNFIWQGSFPWLYSVYKISCTGVLDIEASIPIPQLRELKGDFYSIKFPVRITYDIQPESFTFISYLGDSGKDLASFIEKLARLKFSQKLDKYFSPQFNYFALKKDQEKILETTRGELNDELTSIGLKLVKFELAGSVIIPGNDTYFDGIRQLKEIQDISKKNEKDLILVSNEIAKQKLENEHFYEKLNRISGIIEKNPDILKYIYIDKLSHSVKVILPSDSAGIPKVFDDMLDTKNKSKQKEIDNLR